jgi:hypothetical protein
VTATLLDRVPLDEITAQAREVRFGRTVLTVIAGVLFGLGWLAYKVAAAAWLCAAWSVVAVKAGWTESRKAEVARRSRARQRLA